MKYRLLALAACGGLLPLLTFVLVKRPQQEPANHVVHQGIAPAANPQTSGAVAEVRSQQPEVSAQAMGTTASTSRLDSRTVERVARVSQWMAHNPSHLPPAEIMESVHADGLDAFMRFYSEQQEPTNRVAATIVLAKIGGDAVATLFTNALGSEFSGRAMDGREWRFMELTLLFLGLVSEDSQVAGGFVSSATSASFWPSFRRWTFQPAMEPIGTELLRGTAWSAAAIAGTYDPAQDWLETPPDHHLPDPLLATHIVDGAFYRSYIMKFGRDGFLGGWIGQMGLVDEYGEWAATADGKRWHSWLESLRSIEPARN